MLEKNNEILIGSHVSMKAPSFFLGSVEETIENNANCLMFYTGAPQNTVRTDINLCKIDEAIELALKSGLNLNNFVCHAPYLINLGNLDQEKYEFSKKLLLNEIERCAAFKCKLLVLHPGLHVKNGAEVALNQIIKALNEIFAIDKNDVIICIETMAGKGTEVGINFDEIKTIIDGIQNKTRIGVCFDTCHLNDAGFNIEFFDDILDEFDTKIGVSYLKVIHLNDSKNVIGARKDRHENIGFGTIGYQSLINVVYNNRVKNIPKILETPFVNGKSPYKKEIEMIKNHKFDENIFKDL